MKPLQLEDFVMTKLHLEWRDPKAKTYSESGISFDYDIARHKEHDRRFMMHFRVALAPQKTKKNPDLSGYVLETEIVGLFKFPEDIEKEKMDYLIRVNGATILYGILRGQLATMTGSFAGGRFTLPTVMMQEVVADIEKAKAGASKKQSKPRKKKASAHSVKGSKKKLKKRIPQVKGSSRKA